MRGLWDLFKIKYLEIAKVQPGDGIIVTVPFEVSVEQADRARAKLEALFPDNKIVVKQDTTEIQIVRCEVRRDDTCTIEIKAVK